MTSPNIHLISGIPRSGTTLSCSLINKYSGSVALHEPIQPKQITADSREAMISLLERQLDTLWESFQTGNQLDNGDTSLSVDNPVGSNEQNKLRTVTARRGKVSIGNDKSRTKLFVKQNAMFTALSEELSGRYQFTGIVRNPIDVFISWLAVDLPVNRGQLPAGEMLDGKLHKMLSSESSTFKRQCIIYQWFIDQFESQKIQVVRYEDILNSQASALFDNLGIFKLQNANPQFKTANQPSSNILETIINNESRIRMLNVSSFYSEEEISQRFEQIHSNVV